MIYSISVFSDDKYTVWNTPKVNAVKEQVYTDSFQSIGVVHWAIVMSTTDWIIQVISMQLDLTTTDWCKKTWETSHDIV